MAGACATRFRWRRSGDYRCAGKSQVPEFVVDDEALVYEFTRELNLTRAVSSALFGWCMGPEATVRWLGFLAITA